MTTPDRDHLRVGEVARAFGVSVSTVRRWDRVGLLNSWRTPGGQRRFPRDEIDAARKRTTTERRL